MSQPQERGCGIIGCTYAAVATVQIEGEPCDVCEYHKDERDTPHPYPKILVLSRSDPNLDPPVLVIQDGKELRDQEEVRARISMFYGFENQGAVKYQYTPIPVGEVEGYMEQLRRKLGGVING